MRLTERDRHLCGLLAQARWLTTEQLTRLMFPGRHERYVRKRLTALSDYTDEEGPPLLVRHKWITREATKQVWGLTPAGCTEAELLLDDEFPSPPQTLDLETMKRHVALAELFVALLAVPVEAALMRVPSRLTPADRKRAIGGLFARATHRNWRWTVAGPNVQLAWKQDEKGHHRDRMLRPHAILELVEQRRRVFIECEVGGTPKGVGEEARTTALSTLSRMENYFCGIDFGARRTWYQERFRDEFSPELLFLVRSERRAENLTAAINTRPPAFGADNRIKARAKTLGAAVASFLEATGNVRPPPAKPPRIVDSGEVRLVGDFYRAAIATIQGSRHEARSRRAAEPSYPQQTEQVRALLAKWSPPKHAT